MLENLCILSVDAYLVKKEQIESFYGKKVTVAEIANELKIPIKNVEIYGLKEWMGMYNDENINSYHLITVIEKVW